MPRPLQPGGGAIRCSMPLLADDLTGWTLPRLRNVREACERALDSPALWPAPANRVWLAWINAEIAARLPERAHAE